MLLNFTLTEYHARLQTVRDAMANAGIECFIISDPSNMCWLTGFDAWSFYVHQCVVVGPTGEPLWIGRPMDARAAEKTTWLDHSRIFEYSDDYVQNPTKHPMSVVASIIADFGWHKGSVGVEMDNYYFSAACYTTLQSDLQDGRIKDATSLVNWCRAVKSEAEIAFIRRAAQIAENMQSRAMALIEPGMRKCDLVAEIYKTAISGTVEFGGDYPAIVPLLPTGADAAAAHMTWSDERFENETGTFMELAGVYKRYHCPLARTVYLGQPSQKFLDTEKAILEGIQAALDTVKPGVTCEAVEAAWRKTIAKYGLEKESRIGYSTGLSYPPDWGERTMSLRPGDQSVLKPNMVFHLIPAIWMEDWGMEITETFLVTDKGAEPFCQFPRRLFVKP